MPTSRPVKTSDKLGDILDYYTDIGGLATEMEKWASSMPASLQGFEKHGQVGDAATSLDEGARGLEEFSDNVRPILESIPDILDKEVSYTMNLMYKGYRMPRWVRLANPVAAYSAAVSLIKESMESWSLNEDKLDELKEWLNQIDEVISDLQGVEFPTMYG
jgi:hypothetical protein